MRAFALIVILILSQGCAHWDPFVSFKPLFAGLDESGMTATARAVLAEAKFDFQRAGKSHPPHYARLINDDSHVGAKNYQGRGYLLTGFHGGPRHRVGTKIVVDEAITGSKPFRYDESFEQWD